ncbi:MAG TPA: MFS transporter [Candidatus Bathyarchaeia archaeon]|nr:MFS transporter [Candidatus Bathyarchaeia archaeon]
MTSSSNRILYLVSLNHATNDGSVYLLSSLFPIVLALFNISVFQVGIIVALGYLVNILFQPVVGHYSEGRDPERLLAIGISVITVSVISFVFATGFLSLLASVILLRLGSSFFHPVGISAISKSYGGPRLQKSMGFQSAFGNVGVLLVFLTSAPLYLALGWRATFIVFAIWTLADVVLTLTFLRGRHSAGSDDPQTPSISKPQTRRMIPLFFVLAAFISGGTYAVILNFANIFLGTRAHLDVSQANLIVSSFIAFASLGAIATGGSTRFVPTNVLLAISYLVAACSVAAFTLLSGNAILATITLLATGFSISATYPLTYTELSRYLGSIGQQSGRSFGVLSSGQTIGASILGLASGYVSQFFSLEVSFASVAMLALVGSVSAAFWIKRREPKSLIADIG